MTKCNRSKLTFSSLSRKKIIADFNGGRLTSDGGGLLREVNRRTERTKALVYTIRLKLLKVAARVVVTARRVVLHFSSSCPYQALISHVVARLAPT